MNKLQWLTLSASLFLTWLIVKTFSVYRNREIKLYPDCELTKLRKERKIRLPDVYFHHPVYDLNLCINCNHVFSDNLDHCPNCTSEISVSLYNIIGGK
jgi:hypothetical protein